MSLNLKPCLNERCRSAEVSNHDGSDNYHINHTIGCTIQTIKTVLFLSVMLIFPELITLAWDA
jgi:hypothetical protein